MILPLECETAIIIPSLCWYYYGCFGYEIMVEKGWDSSYL